MVMSPFTSMSQTTFSKYLHLVTEMIVTHLTERYISFPSTNDDCLSTAAQFEHQIKGVIGLIDGTHIALTNVKKESEHIYVNRKGSKSINAQIVSRR